MKKISILVFGLICLVTKSYSQNCLISIDKSKRNFCINDSLLLNSSLSESVNVENYKDSSKVLDLAEVIKPSDRNGFLTFVGTGFFKNMDLYSIKNLFPTANIPTRIDDYIDLNLTNSQNLSNVLVNSGKLILTIYTDLKQEIILDLEFPTMKRNGISFKEKIKIDSNTSVSLKNPYIKIIDLSNVYLNLALDNGKINYKIDPNIIIRNSNITAQEQVLMKIELNDFKFSNGYTYEWFKDASNTSFTKEKSSLYVKESGVYKVIATSKGMCPLVTDTIKVTKIANPEIKFDKIDTTIIIGSQLIVKATGAKTYLWNDQSKYDTLRIKDAGTYTVTGTNEFGCVSSKSITINVRQKGVGTSTLNQLNLTISPNPVSEILTVSLENFKNNSLTIVDLKGNQILKQPLTDYKTEINVNSFAKGIYLVNITDNLNTVLNTKRFVVE